ASALQRAFEDSHPLNDLPRGSSVRLVYQEKVSRDGTAHQVGGLEAAQIKDGHETLSAFAFRDEHGQPHFYDANGDALGLQSLRFPITFSYISSGFTFHRWHPILHEYRPHVGVDLAAHYGTPVKAIADGRVDTAGWCGELGRCVRIHHDGDMVSIYGHLSRIASGLRPGDEVTMGQVIGRVGSTGLSTGPHLHFAIEKDGRYVNPLTQHLGVHHQVSPRMRNLFDHLKQQYLVVLDRLPDFGGHFAAPHSLVAGNSASVDHRANTAGVSRVARRSRRSRRSRVTRAVASSAETATR
ncbi:MAG: M23 family metallopeptidase, partial [Candidatus Binataceae bacterium]